MDIEKSKQDYKKFSEWLDRICQNNVFPQTAVALCFNIYDDGEYYGIQLIGSESFDVDNSDWACDEVFSTGEDLCLIKKSSETEDFKVAEKCITEFVKQYLCDGKFSAKLKCYKAIGIGFVDGDLFVVQL